MDPTLARPGAPQWAPRPSPPPAVRRPSTAGYWIAALVAVITVGGGGIALVLGLAGMQQMIEDYARTPVPGSVTVQAEEPTTFVVFSEGLDSEPTDHGGSIAVTGPNGDAVPLLPYVGEVTYETGTGSAGTALATFRAATTGTYMVTARGNVPNAQIAVGEDVPVVRTVLLPLGVGALGMAIAITILIVTATRRSAAARDAVLARSYWYRQ